MHLEVARKKPKGERTGGPSFPVLFFGSDSHVKGAPLLARCSRGVGFEDVHNPGFDFVVGETLTQQSQRIPVPDGEHANWRSRRERRNKTRPLNVHRIPPSRTARESGAHKSHYGTNTKAWATPPLGL